ncbi:MAG: hypothetical protein ABMB14_29630 [Myxococcota bacterium]
MDRRWLGFAVGCAALGVVGIGLLGPDGGPPTSPAPAAAAIGTARPAPSTAAARAVGRVRGAMPASGAIPVDEGDDEPFDTRADPQRAPVPPPLLDPNQVYPSDLRGIATAALARRDGFVRCATDYRAAVAEANGPDGDPGYDGRLTLKLTVTHGAGDRGISAAEVVNGPADAVFDACISAVMLDARFEAPDHDQSVMWPVPMPGDW